MTHPTEAELRQLGHEILDLLEQKTFEETESYFRARHEQVQRDYAEGDEVSWVQAEIEAEVRTYIRDTYGFLPDLFAQFAHPAPEDFQAALSGCASALMVLEPQITNGSDPSDVKSVSHFWEISPEILKEYPTTISERIDTIKGQVVSWSGNAAHAFNWFFLDKLLDAQSKQHQALKSLTAALEANQKIFEHVGQDILEIGEKTKEALRHVTDKDPSGVIVTLTVVAAVASVASAGAATPATTVTFALVAAAGSATAEFYNASVKSPKQVKIEGATTQAVMASMMERIYELQQYTDGEEDEIALCLRACLRSAAPSMWSSRRCGVAGGLLVGLDSAAGACR